MTDYEAKELYMDGCFDKQIKIETEDGYIIDNTMLYSEQFELTESLCSEPVLKFGCCESSCLKFKTYFIPANLVGKKITVSENIDGTDGEGIHYGEYKIYSVKPTADKESYEFLAYDALYDVINADVAVWYNGFFADGNEKSLKDFRDSFFMHFGIEQDEVSLPNDWIPVKKTVSVSAETSENAIREELSGNLIVTAICEINGCFGHINRNGKFEYIFLNEIESESYEAQLYPSDNLLPSDNLYPNNTQSEITVYEWQKDFTEYEDFVTENITKLTIIQQENDVGVSVGVDGNTYTISENLLTYSLTNYELNLLAQNILDAIKKVAYRPLKAYVIGNPCVTVGSIVKIVTNSAILKTYMLERTLSGVQSKSDTIEAKGEQFFTANVNSTASKLEKLQGRSNVLERSLDETKLQITNIAEGLQTEITQTASEIRTEVNKADEELSSRISQTISSVDLSVNNGDKTASIKISISNEDGTTSEVSGTIAMTGVVTFDNLSSAGSTVINGENITTGNINCDRLNGGSISGQNIKGCTITASNVEAVNDYYIYDPDVTEKKVKVIHFASDSTSDTKVQFGRLSDNGYGSGTNRITFSDESQDRSINLYTDLTTINSRLYANKDIDVFGTSYIHGNLYAGNNLHVRTNYGIYNDDIGAYLIHKYSSVGEQNVDHTRVGNGNVATALIGKNNIYANHAITEYSDERLKEDFSGLEKYEELFMSLKPVAYRFKNGNSGRTHIGITAQSLKKSLEESNMSTMDFAGYVKFPTDPELLDYIDTDDMHGVRYDEFIMLNTHMIQKMFAMIEELQKEVDELKTMKESEV